MSGSAAPPSSASPAARRARRASFGALDEASGTRSVGRAEDEAPRAHVENGAIAEPLSHSDELWLLGTDECHRASRIVHRVDDPDQLDFITAGRWTLGNRVACCRGGDRRTQEHEADRRAGQGLSPGGQR